MAIAGILLFSIAWLLVFTGMRDALAPINRHLKKAQKITPNDATAVKSTHSRYRSENGRRSLAFDKGHGLAPPKAVA